MIRLSFLRFGGLFGARKATPKPTLAELDPEYASLKRERDKHRSLHSKGARELQQRLEQRVHEHLERGRA
jgi:hypothetical protein